jgi:hypothetical protein
MATPQPTDGDVDRSAPHGQEAGLIVRALASAPHPRNGLTVLQAALSKGHRRRHLGTRRRPPPARTCRADVLGDVPQGARQWEVSNRHHVSRGSEAGAITAKPCDPTATAQEEGR